MTQRRKSSVSSAQHRRNVRSDPRKRSEVLAFLAELSDADRSRVRASAKRVLSGDRGATTTIVQEAQKRSYGTIRMWMKTDSGAITVAEMILDVEPSEISSYQREYLSNKRQRRNGSAVDDAVILNCEDADESTALVHLWMGASAPTHFYYWGSFEDAFEAAVEWADDNAPGLLTQIGPEDYRAAAEDEGIAWNDSWPDFADPDFERVVQAAEVDMTMIGHTTLEHGNAVPSWEWGGNDVTDEEEFEAVLGRCKPYIYKLAYEIVTPESAEEGDVEDRGWEVEESDPMSLEDLVRDVRDHNWIEWSSTNPSGKGDWLISEGEVEDYSSGAEKSYHLFIERVDEQPLSGEELREISRELDVPTFGRMFPNAGLRSGPKALIQKLAAAPREFAHSSKGSEMASKALRLVERDDPDQADAFLAELVMLGYNPKVTR